MMVKGSRQSTFCRYTISSMILHVGWGTMLPVRLGCDEFGDRMGQGRVRSDVEHGKRVFPIVHAPRRKDDGDEMRTGVVEERS